MGVHTHTHATHTRTNLHASSLARAAALCNEAELEAKADGWAVLGDPMEGALLAFAAKTGQPVEAQVYGTTAYAPFIQAVL